MTINFECEHCKDCVFFYDRSDECMNPERKATMPRASEALHTEPYRSACDEFLPDLDCRHTRASEERNELLRGIADNIIFLTPAAGVW